MTARANMSGHPVKFTDGAWRYEDGSVARQRECRHCGESPDAQEVLVPAALSHTGEDRWAWKPIDACIAPIVRALNLAAIYTRSCCCGHGEQPGQIMLHDGRILFIETRKWEGTNG